ncbi:MAG: histidine phosphatase family protein [Alphaproteobacteria bacterium]|nr:histidine phosphatase family protein [Alphaproteobacteria bacterium]
MALIYFVRHGKAAAGFGEDRDPGLNALGHAQAAAIAPRLIAAAPAQLISSPLRRARETAAPVEAALGRSARIEHSVSEIASPMDDLAARAVWVRAAMQGNWSDLLIAHQQWRRGVVDTLLALPQDSVIFSHFVAINAAVSHALGGDRVTHFSPDNCSITIFDNTGGMLRVIELGQESETAVG